MSNSRKSTNRIRVIEGSLRCFALGSLGLVPIFGIPAAAIAILQTKQVQAELEEGWNPAEKHLWWGYLLAWAGLAFSTGVTGGLLTIILFNLLS